MLHMTRFIYIYEICSAEFYLIRPTIRLRTVENGREWFIFYGNVWLCTALKGLIDDTFKILDYSQYFIEQGDFEMAIKLLQQLEGEPKNIAKDFINEALLLLEVKQAVSLITTFISSLYVSNSINQ